MGPNVFSGSAENNKNIPVDFWSDASAWAAAALSAGLGASGGRAAADGRERRIKQKRGQSGERTPWSSNNILVFVFFFLSNTSVSLPKDGCWTKNTISSEIDPFVHHAAPSLRRDCHTQLINITPRKDQTMHFWWFFFFFLTWIHIWVITFPPRQQTSSVSLHVRASEEAMRSNNLLIAEEHLKAMGSGVANY